MTVDIEPQELGFRRPFTVEVAEVLKIKNPNTQPVAFKVKTTAPKQYCVRPNSGRVEPGKEVEVSVILQAMKQEPPADTKCRDKFLVQSVPISGDKEFSNLTAIWDSVEKSAIQERKIRVVFLPASGGVPNPALETPSKPIANGHDATPELAPPAYSSPADYTIGPDETSDIKQEQPSPSLGAAAAVAATKHSEPSYDELKQQLVQAEKLVNQLKQDQGGLRQRKTESSSADAKTANSKPSQLAQQARSGPEGVPVRITALLCFLSFLLAYLFF